MYKPQYKNITTSKGSNLISQGLPIGQSKGTKSQTSIKSMSQQYTVNSLGQIKMSDHTNSNIIPPFESQKNLKQLTHTESLNLFKKAQDSNTSKQNIQKTPNNNNKQIQPTSPTGQLNGSSNSKMTSNNLSSNNNSQSTQSTQSITPFNKYSSNYLNKVKNISIGSIQNLPNQQANSKLQQKSQQSGYLNDAQQAQQQKSEPYQTILDTHKNINDQGNFDKLPVPQAANQQNSNPIQPRTAKLDLIDFSNEQPVTKSSEDASNNQSKQQKNVSEQEYEKAQSALHILKSKMKRGISQTGYYNEEDQSQNQKQQPPSRNDNSDKQYQRGSELIGESKWFRAEDQENQQKQNYQDRTPLQDNKDIDQYERRGSNNNIYSRNDTDNNRKQIIPNGNNNRRQNSNNMIYDQELQRRQNYGEEENINYDNRPRTAQGNNPSSYNFQREDQNDNRYQGNPKYPAAIKTPTNQHQYLDGKTKPFQEDDRFENQRSQIQKNNNLGREQHWKGKEMGNIMSYEQFREQNNMSHPHYHQPRDDNRQQQYPPQSDKYYDNYDRNYRNEGYHPDDRGRNYPPRYEPYDNYPPHYDYYDNYNRGYNNNYYNERDYYNRQYDYDQNLERSQWYPPQNRYYNGPPSQYIGSEYDRDYQRQRRVSEFQYDYPDNPHYQRQGYRRQTDVDGYRGEMQYDPSRYQVDGFQKSQPYFDQKNRRDVSNPRLPTRNDQQYHSDNYLRGQRSRSPISQSQQQQQDGLRPQQQIYPARPNRQEDQSPFNRRDPNRNVESNDYNGSYLKGKEVERNNKSSIQSEGCRNDLTNNNRYNDQPDYFKSIKQQQEDNNNNQKRISDLKNEDLNPRRNNQHETFKSQQLNKVNDLHSKETNNYEREQDQLKSPINKQKLNYDDQQRQKQVDIKAFDEQRGQITPNQSKLNKNLNDGKSQNSINNLLKGNVKQNLDFEEQPIKPKNQQNQKENIKNFDDTPTGGSRNNKYPVGDDQPIRVNNQKINTNYEDIPIKATNQKSSYEDYSNKAVNQKQNVNYDDLPIKVANQKNMPNLEEYPTNNKQNNKQQIDNKQKQVINNNINQNYENIPGKHNKQDLYSKNNQRGYNQKSYAYEDDGDEFNVDEGPTNLNTKQMQSREVKTLQSNYDSIDDRPIKSSTTGGYDLKNIPAEQLYGANAQGTSNKFNNNQKKNTPISYKQQQVEKLQIQENPNQKIQLFECSLCSRKFNEESLVKHEKICKKVFIDKRKQFDIQAQRLDIDGKNDLEITQASKPVKQQKKNIPKKESNQQKGKGDKPDWLKQSEAFRMQMRQNKTGQTDPESAAIMQEALGHVPCNFCGRKFNKIAAERHIPFCEKKAKENQMKGAGNKQAANNLNSTQNNKVQQKQSNQIRPQTSQSGMNAKRY